MRSLRYLLDSFSCRQSLSGSGVLKDMVAAILVTCRAKIALARAFSFVASLLPKGKTMRAPTPSTAFDLSYTVMGAPTACPTFFQFHGGRREHQRWLLNCGQVPRVGGAADFEAAATCPACSTFLQSRGICTRATTMCVVWWTGPSRTWSRWCWRR